GWRAIAPGDHWGGQDENAWFHGAATPPAQWTRLARKRDGLHAIALRLRLGSVPHTDFGWPEGLLYLNGAFLQGINQHHIDLLLPTDRVRPGPNTFDVRAWSGMLPRDHRLEFAELALINREVETLYHILYAGCDLVDALDANDPLLHPLLSALEDAWNQIDLRQPASVQLDESAARALVGLRERLGELRAAFTPAERPCVTAIGHGHLDVAW